MSGLHYRMSGTTVDLVASVSPSPYLYEKIVEFRDKDNVASYAYLQKESLALNPNVLPPVGKGSHFHDGTDEYLGLGAFVDDCGVVPTDATVETLSPASDTSWPDYELLQTDTINVDRCKQWTNGYNVEVNFNATILLSPSMLRFKVEIDVPLNDSTTETQTLETPQLVWANSFSEVKLNFRLYPIDVCTIRIYYKGGLGHIANIYTKYLEGA